MTAEQPQLLVVVADPTEARSLETALRKRGFADARFAVSARIALNALAARPAQFVLADSDLPGVDGVELMRAVEAKHPDAVRVLVADSRKLRSLRTSGIAHRCLARPWNVDAIIEVVRRRSEPEASLADQGLRQLLATTDRLPVAPSAYTRITAEMRSREPSMDRVAAIVAEDPALTAQVLRHVNSALVALRNEITTVDRAVALLGKNHIVAIVLSIELDGRGGGAPFELIESIKQSAMKVAALTRLVAEVEGAEPDDRDAAFLAAMLRDCGKLVMATNWPRQYVDIADSDDLARETELIGADHSLVGAHLLAAWNLADVIVEAVAHHHRPSAGNFDAFGVIGLVHVAHALAQRPGDGTLPGLDVEFIRRFDLWDQIAVWIGAADEYDYESANSRVNKRSSGNRPYPVDLLPGPRGQSGETTLI